MHLDIAFFEGKNETSKCSRIVFGKMFMDMAPHYNLIKKIFLNR